MKRALLFLSFFFFFAEVAKAAPNTVISTYPPSVVTTNHATFGFYSTEEPATFQCKLNSASWVGCVSLRNYVSLPDGPYTFQVRATSSTGQDTTPATFSFTINAQEPQTTIHTGPNGVTDDSSPMFTFSSSEPGGYQCSVDSSVWFNCASPLTLSTLADGSHSFQVRAYDTTGRFDSTPATRNFQVVGGSGTLPNTSITSGPSGVIQSKSVSFEFTSTHSGSFECSLDNGVFSPCSSPKNYFGLTEGNHVFYVRSKTFSGTDPSPAFRSFTVDSSSPVGYPDTDLADAPMITNDSTPSFSFTSTMSGSLFQCRVDLASWQACSSPENTAPLSDGEHTFQVRAVFSSLADPTPAEHTFNVDTTAPQSTIESVVVIQGVAGVEFQANEYSTFHCQVNSGAWFVCKSLLRVELANGKHTVRVRAIDRAGNVEATPQTEEISVGEASSGACTTKISSLSSKRVRGSVTGDIREVRVVVLKKRGRAFKRERTLKADVFASRFQHDLFLERGTYRVKTKCVGGQKSATRRLKVRR